MIQVKFGTFVYIINVSPAYGSFYVIIQSLCCSISYKSLKILQQPHPTIAAAAAAAAASSHLLQEPPGAFNIDLEDSKPGKTSLLGANLIKPYE